jgi:steroid delta-isomerase-like uncharacterized protein
MTAISKTVLLGLVLSACKNDKPSEPPPPSPTPAPTVAPTVPPPAAKPKPTFTTPQAKLQRYMDCWKAFDASDYDTFAGCFTPDAMREQVDSVPPLVAQGTQKIVDMAKTQRGAFPDLQITPQLVVISGNDIAAIIHVLGTNTGDVPGMSPTSRKLGIFESEIATIDDNGMFTHDSLYVDQPTIYHQLGLLENDTSPKAIVDHVAAPVMLVSGSDPAEAANKALIEHNLDAVNKKKAKVVEATAADNIKLTYHGEKQQVVGKRAFGKWLEDALHSTTDGFVDVKRLWTAGEWVVVADTFTGTPSDEQLSHQGDAKHIETHVVQFFRIHDGKLAEQQIFANRLQTAVQLGFVDPDQLMETLSKSKTTK